MTLTLTKSPVPRTGVGIRRAPDAVFEALVNPDSTSRFWYTKSTGRMEPGAELVWTWEMYGVSSRVVVLEIIPDRLIRFRWDGYEPANPTEVEFRLIPYGGDRTYVQVTETGFTGDGDTQVERAMESAAGFTFVLACLKAFLEHSITLTVVLDAHPSGLGVPPEQAGD